MHYVFLPKDIQFPQNIFLPTFISFTVNISQKLYLEHNKNEYIAKVVKSFFGEPLRGAIHSYILSSIGQEPDNL